MATDPVPLRFDVALSFAGEYREFVSGVAASLATTFTADRVLYDTFHDEEFARPDLNIYLPSLYRKQSELLVVFLCPDYAVKTWCRLEWRHIAQLISTVDAKRIMFLSFGPPGDLSEIGILSGDGYIDVTPLTPETVAEKIRRRLSINQGQGQRAAALGLQEAVAQGSQDPVDIYNRALRSISDRQYDRAIEDLNRVIDVDPTLAQAYYNRGLTYYFKSDLNRAIADFDQAEARGFRDALVYRNRGNAFSRKGDVARALADYKTAIDLDPGNPIAYLNRGEVYENTRQKALAIADYQVVMTLISEPQWQDTARARLLALGVRA